MEKWFVTAKSGEFDKWAQEFQISPVLARILRNRELKEELTIRKFLFGTLEDCYSPWLLKDMDRAVEAIEQAIATGIKIRVIGDYDVDGICAAHILTSGLKRLGAQADTMIPHRIHDGYGLNEHLIREAVADGIGMIVTCDNGIAAIPQIQMAVEAGIQVVVTDHHEVPFAEERDAQGNVQKRQLLPPALAVVDPKRLDDTYPFPNICGAVVAYKLIQALTKAQEENKNGYKSDGNNERISDAESERGCDRNTGDAKVQMEQLLEFAALATVCDVMELLDENRIIVKEGLKRLRKNAGPGLRALMEVNGIEPEQLNAYHLGFVLGPCLNATGRLDTAARALELLQCQQWDKAVMYARELKELNDSRKNLTLQGVEEAEQYLQDKGILEDGVYLIYLPHVHESLAGIIAGRIREKYNHPVFVLTKGEEGVKGSGRSIEAYHMYEAMVRCKELFTKFGGHKMAAGLSMEEDNIEELRSVLNQDCGLQEEDFVTRVTIDVPMPLSYASEELARQLQMLEPYGVGNPKPLFAEKNVTLQSVTIMGKSKNVLRLRVAAGGNRTYQMVRFGNPEQMQQYLADKYGTDAWENCLQGRGNYLLSVVYQLGINSYKGRQELQYILQHYC